MSSTAPPAVAGGGNATPRHRHRALQELRRRVAGTLYTAEDPGWDAARTPWALCVTQTPLAVLEVRDAADVQAAVRWATAYDLQVSAQPVGHGASDSLDGVLLLRTGALRGIDIDVERRTVWVDAGVKSGDLLDALDGTGLTFLAGSNPDTSVVGLTIGGGMSWFGRAYGLAANSIVAVDLVDGLGRTRHVTHDTDPELFWAIRGGGGDFGIVTRMELALHPAPSIYGGHLFWPVTRMGEVMRAFRAVTAAAPPELTIWYHTYRLPPLPHVPEPVRGKACASVAVAYFGPAAEAERHLAPVRAIPGVELDLMGEVALGALGTIGGEPTRPTPGIDTSELLERLDDTTIDRLVALLGEGSTAPLAVFQIRHLGAAFADDRPGNGAAGHIVAQYQMFALDIAADPALAGPIRTALSRVRDAVASCASGRIVPNFLDAGGDVDRCWPLEVRERLAAVKAGVDPLHTIRSNRSVQRSAG